MGVRVGVNGFGRIGRVFFRAALTAPELEVVAVNDLADAKTLAHLLKYDSVHGILNAEVTHKGEAIFVNGREVRVCSAKDPAALPWSELGVDIVVESTGVFRDKATTTKHLQAGAKKVVITAPAKDPDITIVLGVNEQKYDPARHELVSNASCTTNCLATVAKVLSWLRSFARSAPDGRYEVDPRFTLAVLGNTLGPKLFKWGTQPASIQNVWHEATELLEKPASAQAVNDAFRAAASGPLHGILDATDEELVSVDFNGNPHSSIVDLASTAVIDGSMVKVLAWYDNEWGYSNRVKDLIRYMSKSL